MNPIVFALRRPVTTLMLVVALVGGGALALTRMRVDIFPPINQPQIFVFVNYGGYDPGQMEGLLVSQFELWFQYVDGVRNIESKSIQQVAVIQLSFYPGTDMSSAMSQVVSVASRAQAGQPSGTLPPLIMQMDAGSVPVGYLVFRSKTRSLGEIGDLAQNRIRALVQAYVPGTVATSPFGTAIRSIAVSADPDKLRSYNLTPQDLVTAINAGNAISPSGNLYVRDEMPLVPNNAMIRDPKEFGSIPLKPGRNVYLRDVATVSDATDVNYGYALVDGRKSIYLPVVKKNTASTLEVVSNVHKGMPVFKSALPEDVDVSFAFDESPTVVTAVTNVATEGLIGATLTGLMILIFLRDWRSVIVVVFNIPMALLGALCGLWLTGNTINIMTLGGLALAIGILVDEATVSIENIHVQMTRTPSLARAVERGSNETAVPRLLALLCVLSVFIPAFIMAEPVRSLFVPLALAVGFAMVTSYFLSSTVVPVLSVWLLKHHGPPDARSAGAGAEPPARRPGLLSRLSRRLPAVSFARVQAGFGAAVGRLVRRRWLVVPAYLGLCAALLAGLGPRLGTELFPQVDSGEFVVRFRAPPGSNFEITRQIWTKALQVIQEEAGAENVDISMGFAGQVSPVFSINNLILFMRGPDDGQMRVALREGGGVHLQPFRERLRTALPEKVKPWLAELLQRQGLTPEAARARAGQVLFGFEPGDIVSEVMSFGSPTPVEIVVASPNLADSRAHAQRILAEMKKIPSLRDVKFQQELDYPTVPVEIDRERAGLSGATAQQVADAVVVSTSSSRYIARNFWLDPKAGVSYQVQVLIPTPRMNSPAQMETVPLGMVHPDLNLLIRDVAKVGQGAMPGEIDRTTMQRYVSITANVEGEDLGRAARRIEQAVAAAGQPPRGVRVQTRGQVAPMYELFTSLGIGLGIAVVVILVLLTAYFQSSRLALAAVAAVPGVLCGIVVVLLATGTTLNIESFMGAIMCIGVSVSNSVMLVTFIAKEWQEGKPVPEAARAGAQDRLRPILMTACAMTVGMVPMALALEQGSEMQAPLGRAVIGGLVVSTFVTLFIVPSVFALLMGHRVPSSPSLHPDDPASPNYDPAGRESEASPGVPAASPTPRPEAHP
ncbi:MAG: czcA 6 [Gemmataceae bacterium]|nr:czcA 6 [Gemmataceae bacterium]